MAVANTDWMDAIAKLPARTLGRSAASNRADAGAQDRFGDALSAAASTEAPAAKPAARLQDGTKPVAAERRRETAAPDRTRTDTAVPDDTKRPETAKDASAPEAAPSGETDPSKDAVAADDSDEAADTASAKQEPAATPQAAPDPVVAPVPTPEQAARAAMLAFLAVGAQPTVGATDKAGVESADASNAAAAASGAAIVVLQGAAGLGAAAAGIGTIRTGGTAALPLQAGAGRVRAGEQTVAGLSLPANAAGATDPDALPVEAAAGVGSGKGDSAGTDASKANAPKTDSLKAEAAGTDAVGVVAAMPDKPDFLAALTDATQATASADAPALNAPTATAPAHAAAAVEKAAAQNTAPAVPLGQVPMTIGLRSLAGSSQFEIRLDPGDLGRIDVTLDIDKERGTVMTHLVVERIDTLAMLQRDAGSLQQALSQAGLDATEGSISLSLRGEGAAGGDNSGARDGQARNGGGSRTGETPDAASPIDIVPLRSLRGLGGLDIRI